MGGDGYFSVYTKVFPFAEIFVAGPMLLLVLTKLTEGFCSFVILSVQVDE